ncbi:MAG TPA: ATP-binding protein, partial [Clostridia bacterium]|nr:ATP-binding protein [Clostridia bacterium]
VKALLDPQLGQVGVQLRIELVREVWIWGDPHQMEQVLINLVQNAMESIEGNGWIALKAGEDSDGRVMLKVEDNGRGIPGDIETRVFDPFFSTKKNGTGLGLKIAAGIVERHGGVLRYRTKVGSGTTFTILLPCSKGNERELQAQITIDRG